MADVPLLLDHDIDTQAAMRGSSTLGYDDLLDGENVNSSHNVYIVGASNLLSHLMQLRTPLREQHTELRISPWHAAIQVE